MSSRRWCNERELFLHVFPPLTCKFWVSPNVAPQLCNEEVDCTVCNIVRHGPSPQLLGNGCEAIGVVHEPNVPIHHFGNDPMSKRGGTPVRYVCFVCHVALGNISWSREVKGLVEGGRDAKGALIDSWLVEGGDTDNSTLHVVKGRGYVLPVNAIIFAVASNAVPS